MPFVNGRFYMNPAHGRGVERARSREAGQINSDLGVSVPDEHWVTIDGRHVLIREPQKGHNSQQEPKQFSGDATFCNLPGAKTASGQIFDGNKMAAAMTAEKAKLGQNVTVTYTSQDANGNSVTRSITVRVNDRGPFARNTDGKPLHPLEPDPNGVIDLTPAAFRQLVETLRRGRVQVTVTVPND